MKLLFDLTATQPSPEAKFHGGGRYAEIILFKLIELKKEFSCIYDSTRFINPSIISICEEKQIQLLDISQDKIANVIKSHGFDVLYSAIPNFLYNQNISDCIIIGTIHGLRDIETPINKDFFKYDINLKIFLKYLLRTMFPCIYIKLQRNRLNLLFQNHNFRFITVSNHSKYSIMSYFPRMKEEDIRVYYSPSVIGEIVAKDDNREQYFLLVSGNRWIKNNYRAIIAFDQLFDERPEINFKVIITGLSQKSKIRNKIKNKSHFIFYEYVNESVLAKLYANAYCFVYPSVNEGFGYPPLEAMAYSVPVIASPITSISEICGNAALYFNPFSIDEIKNRILMILNQNIYREYSEKALLRYNLVTEKQNRDLDALVNYILNIAYA